MSRIVRQIEAELVNRWNKILELKTAVEGTKRDEVIERFDFELFPGEENYVVEFKLVNGDKESGPYLDIILWDDSNEVFVSDPSHQKIDDEFFVRDSHMNREFTIVLETKKQG